jgi:hypothetical protein
MKLVPATRGTDIVIEFSLANGFTRADYSEIWFALRTQPPAETVPNDDDPDVLFKAKLTDAPSAIAFAANQIDGTITIPATTNQGWLVNRHGYYFGMKGQRAATGLIVPMGSGRLPVEPDIPRAAP